MKYLLFFICCTLSIYSFAQNKDVLKYSLYLGNVSEGGKIRLLPNTLIHYDSTKVVATNSPYSLRDITLKVNGKSYAIPDGRVPADLVSTLNTLRAATENHLLEIVITAKIYAPDCIPRFISGVYWLI